MSHTQIQNKINKSYCSQNYQCCAFSRNTWKVTPNFNEWINELTNLLSVPRTDHLPLKMSTFTNLVICIFDSLFAFEFMNCGNNRCHPPCSLFFNIRGNFLKWFWSFKNILGSNSFKWMSTLYFCSLTISKHYKVSSLFAKVQTWRIKNLVKQDQKSIDLAS